GTSNSTSISIPTTGAGYNYDVDWDNDGTFDEFGITGDVTHDFTAAGTYTIRIQGDFPRIYFNSAGDRAKILSVDQWGNQVWTSMANAFEGASNLTVPATDAPDLTSVSDFSYMFSSATSFNQDISSWDVSSGTDFSYMFYYAIAFNQDISTWDVSSGTNFSTMFFNASAFNQDISSWDVSSGTNFSSMFSLAIDFNQDISAWNVSSGTNFGFMFYNATSFNQDISSWDVSSGTNFSSMFPLATDFNQDISSWNVSSGINFSYMFYNATSFNQNISAWDMTSATNLTDMLNGATAFSSTNYSSLLVAWNDQALQSGVSFTNTTAQYACSAEPARANMIASDTWTITDGGEAASCSTPSEVESSRGSGSGSGNRATYGCNDETASNHNYFSQHKQSLCKYDTTATANTPVTTDTPTTTKLGLTNAVQQDICKSIYLIKGDKGKDVLSMQTFLTSQDINPGPLDGIFGVKTKAGVEVFQSRYAEEILTPWNLTKTTGWWYKTTVKKAQEIVGCSI
ncbi:MAG: hypothetical protein ACI9AR_000487, partial [Flavobacteriaceae bacterium]